MKIMISLFFYVSLLFLFPQNLWANSQQVVRTGMYYGYAKVPGNNEKFPIYFEIEKDPSIVSEDGQQPLIAYLNIKLGGFTSHEFTAYYYTINNYDWSSREMTLDANSSGLNTDMTVRGVFSEDGETISGEMIPLNSGIISLDFELIYYKGDNDTKVKLYKEIPVIRGLAGEYYGECDGKKTFLQLETIRYQAPYFKDGSIFSSMSINARVYHMANRVVASDRGKASFAFSYTLPQSRYNPFLQKLYILLEEEGECDLVGGVIKCSDTCSLKKIQKDEKDFVGLPEHNKLGAHDIPLENLLFQEKCTIEKRIINDPILQGSKNIETTEENGRSDFKKAEVFGLFYGNLHIEQGNQYKPMFLRVDPTGLPSSNDLNGPLLTQRKLSVAGSLFTGKNEYETSIPISFGVKEFPKEVFSGMYFYGKQDYDLIITKWSTAGIEGKVFSKSFGKVGTFQLRKFTSPKDMQNYEFYFSKNLMSGKYRLPFDDKKTLSFQLSLLRGATGMLPPPSYFPFTVLGRVNFPLLLGRPEFFQASGTIDPFSLVLRLNVDSGEKIYGKFVGDKFKGFISSGNTGRGESFLRRMKVRKR